MILTSNSKRTHNDHWLLRSAQPLRRSHILLPLISPTNKWKSYHWTIIGIKPSQTLTPSHIKICQPYSTISILLLIPHKSPHTNQQMKWFRLYNIYILGYLTIWTQRYLYLFRVLATTIITILFHLHLRRISLGLQFIQPFKVIAWSPYWSETSWWLALKGSLSRLQVFSSKDWQFLICVIC